MLLISQSRMTC